MLWKKRVRAGVMLYALLMVAIFSLLLQFYLNRQVTVARNHQASFQSLRAYTMAQWIRNKVEREQVHPSDDSEKLAQTSTKHTLSKDERELSYLIVPSVTNQGQLSEKVNRVNQETAEGNEGPEKEEGESFSREQKAIEASGETVSGQIEFKDGRATYQLTSSKMTITVELDTETSYSYIFNRKI